MANVWKDFINVKDISEIPAKVSATGFDRADDGIWYAIDGRMPDSRPAKSGIYIHNGGKTLLNE